MSEFGFFFVGGAMEEEEDRGGRLSRERERERDGSDESFCRGIEIHDEIRFILRWMDGQTRREEK